MGALITPFGGKLNVEFSGIVSGSWRWTESLEDEWERRTDVVTVGSFKRFSVILLTQSEQTLTQGAVT